MVFVLLNSISVVDLCSDKSASRPVRSRPLENSFVLLFSDYIEMEFQVHCITCWTFSYKLNGTGFPRKHNAVSILEVHFDTSFWRCTVPLKSFFS